jgi:hypothetical protein
MAMRPATSPGRMPGVSVPVPVFDPAMLRQPVPKSTYLNATPTMDQFTAITTDLSRNRQEFLAILQSSGVSDTMAAPKLEKTPAAGIVPAGSSTARDRPWSHAGMTPRTAPRVARDDSIAAVTPRTSRSALPLRSPIAAAVVASTYHSSRTPVAPAGPPPRSTTAAAPTLGTASASPRRHPPLPTSDVPDDVDVALLSKWLARTMQDAAVLERPAERLDALNKVRHCRYWAAVAALVCVRVCVCVCMWIPVAISPSIPTLDMPSNLMLFAGHVFCKCSLFPLTTTTTTTTDVASGV